MVINSAHATFYLLAKAMLALTVAVCEILTVELYMTLTLTLTLTFRTGRGQI